VKEDVYDILATIIQQILMGIAKLMTLIKWLNSCDFHTCLEILNWRCKSFIPFISSCWVWYHVSL